MSAMKARSPGPNPNALFCALVLINFLNYTDRAIIPGSANEFISLISSTLSTSRPDIYLGFLQSSFIVGFSFASILISHLVHFRGPFYLCAAGLGLWVVSTTLSGIGFYCNSFVLLLIGRMISGIGEASFVCIVPPWIAKHAPPGQKGRWLAIFYTALPVGTAFGYSYAAFIANSLGVNWAFFMESFAMLPLIAILLTFAPYYPSCSSATSEVLAQQELSPVSPILSYSTAAEMITGQSITINPMHISISKKIDATEGTPTESTQSESTDPIPVSIVEGPAVDYNEAPTMLAELLAVSKSPIYICITAGDESVRVRLYALLPVIQTALTTLHICIPSLTQFLTSFLFYCSKSHESFLGIASQAAVLCGLGTFGSAFLMGLGYFDSETAASSTFGSVVCVAGIIGTPLGGVLLDYSMNKNKDQGQGLGQVDRNEVDPESAALTVATDDVATIQRKADAKASRDALKCVAQIITVGTFFGAVSLCSVYVVTNRLLYLLLVTLGCLLVFLCNPGVNIGIMMAVPEKNRSFAIALTSVCVHIFGDVPSPIITGLLKDLLAPGCSPPLGPHPALLALSSPSLSAYRGGSASRECRAEGAGLRLTMLIVSLWLFTSVFLFGIAWYYTYIPEPIAVHANIVRDEKQEKSKQKAFQSKRAYNRLQLQEPLLCLDEESS